ncbi:MAG: hypothetical protein ACE5IE_00600 [Dehalococcoidia bacterium]
MYSIVFAQYVVTALSSGFNAYYFSGYRSSTRRRRIGAVVLAVFSVAICIESLYFGLFSFYQGQEWANAFFLDPSHWLIARLLLLLGSLLVSVLILRQLLANRR